MRYLSTYVYMRASRITNLGPTESVKGLLYYPCSNCSAVPHLRPAAFTVVVLIHTALYAQPHNPSTVHPDFLLRYAPRPSDVVALHTQNQLIPELRDKIKTPLSHYRVKIQHSTLHIEMIISIRTPHVKSLATMFTLTSLGQLLEGEREREKWREGEATRERGGGRMNNSY